MSIFHWFETRFDYKRNIRFGKLLMTLTEQIFDQLSSSLTRSSSENPETLYNALRLLSKWRHLLLQNTLIKNNGLVVLEGPFKGLKFLSKSLEGCYVPKLLGCYEQPLHKVIYKVIETKYEIVLNIGSAEGYYAGGLAKRMPETLIKAFDINQAVKKPISQLLKSNAITNCIYSDQKFLTENFKKYQNRRTLVLCDIEGEEKNLLDPNKAPSLLNMDIIVEAHDCFDQTISSELVRRFSGSHAIEVIYDNGDRILENAPDWFRNLGHLDQLLSFWEWRSGPTPWIIMKSRTANLMF